MQAKAPKWMETSKRHNFALGRRNGTNSSLIPRRTRRQAAKGRLPNFRPKRRPFSTALLCFFPNFVQLFPSFGHLDSANGLVGVGFRPGNPWPSCCQTQTRPEMSTCAFRVAPLAHYVEYYVEITATVISTLDAPAPFPHVLPSYWARVQPSRTASEL